MVQLPDKKTLFINKLNKVCSIDYTPQTTKSTTLSEKEEKILVRDIRHVIRDMYHAACGLGEHSLKIYGP